MAQNEKWSEVYRTLFRVALSQRDAKAWESEIDFAGMERRHHEEISKALREIARERERDDARMVAEGATVRDRFPPSCSELISAMKAARQKYAKETFGARKGPEDGETCPYCAVDGQKGEFNSGWMTDTDKSLLPCVCSKGDSVLTVAYRDAGVRQKVAQARYAVKARLDTIKPTENLADMTSEMWGRLRLAPRGKFDAAWRWVSAHRDLFPCDGTGGVQNVKDQIRTPPPRRNDGKQTVAEVGRTVLVQTAKPVDDYDYPF